MSAPVLLPGDWVYLKVSQSTQGVPRFVDGVRQTPEQLGDAGMVRAHEQTQETVRIFNSLGVFVAGTWQSWGDDVTSGVEVVAIFRNGIMPVNGKAPGL